MLCTICGRREAFYHHTSSGNNVCGVCLRNLLLKRIRRTVSRRKMLGPRPRILYVAHTGLPWEAVPALPLFVRVEKHYGARITVALPRGYRAPLSVGAETIYYTRVEATSIEDYIDALIRRVEHIAGEYDAVALPLTRRAVVAAALAGLGRARPCHAPRPVYAIHGVRIINPLYDTLARDLAAYMYREGMSAPTHDVLGDRVFWELYRELGAFEARNTELLYSAEKGVTYILDTYIDVEAPERFTYTLPENI